MRRFIRRSGFPATGWSRAAAVAALLIVSACGEGPIQPTPSAPPSVTCPANLAVTGVVGGMQSVTYPAPVATGGAAPLTTTCAPTSGSSFPTGATTVSCTTNDTQNRQASCSFSVTLQPLLLTVKRFVAFGDSVTAGEDGRRLQIRFGFIDPAKSYPAVLQS